MEIVGQVIITAGMGLGLFATIAATLFLFACMFSSYHYESTRKVRITDLIGWFTTAFLFCLAAGALFRFG